MKKFLPVILSFLFFTNLFSQNEWNTTWKQSISPVPGETHESGSYTCKTWGIGDTDQDGWGEFIVATADLDTNWIQMYEASADDTYDLVWVWKLTVSANTWYGCAVGDLDNNGVVDIVIGTPTIADTEDPNPPRIWAFEWNGTVGENKYGDYSEGDEPQPHSSWNMDAEDNVDIRPFSLTIEDIDKDDTNELVVGVRANSALRGIRVASITGSFTTIALWNLEYKVEGLSGGSLYSVTTGDLDNDGNREIHALTWDMFTLRITECTGDQQYSELTELIQVHKDSDYGAWDGVVCADIDGNGSNEMFVAGTQAMNQVFVISDISDVADMDSTDVKKLLKLPVTASGKLRTMQLADPDQDGNASLMIAGELNGQIFDLEYKGSGSPADSASWEWTIAFDIFEEAKSDGLHDTTAAKLTPRMNYGHPAGDMDKDGDEEYVFINWSADFGVWENDAYVWVIESSKATGIPIGKNIIPGKITLSQNYPNPFNPETKISYSIQKAGDLSIVIYDMLGRKVRTLVNAHTPAGNHSVVWNGLKDDGLEAASGTYIYQLKTNGTQFSRKMNLVR